MAKVNWHINSSLKSVIQKNQLSCKMATGDINAGQSVEGVCHY